MSLCCLLARQRSAAKLPIEWVARHNCSMLTGPVRSNGSDSLPSWVCERTMMLKLVAAGVSPVNVVLVAVVLGMYVPIADCGDDKRLYTWHTPIFLGTGQANCQLQQHGGFHQHAS